MERPQAPRIYCFLIIFGFACLLCKNRAYAQADRVASGASFESCFYPEEGVSFTKRLNVLLLNAPTAFETVQQEGFQAFDSAAYFDKRLDASVDFWMRFRVGNRSATDTLHIFFHTGSHLSGRFYQIRKDGVFEKKGGIEARRAGISLSNGGLFYYPVQVPPKDSILCYAAIRKTKYLGDDGPVLLTTAQYFDRLGADLYRVQSLKRTSTALVALCFFLALFFGAQFFYNRYAAYAWYAAYLTAFGLFFLRQFEPTELYPVLMGHFPRLLSSSELLWAIPVFYCYGGFVAAIFGPQHLKERISRHLKWARQTMLLLFVPLFFSEMAAKYSAEAYSGPVYAYLGFVSVWQLWLMRRFAGLPERMVWIGSLIVFLLSCVVWALSFETRKALFGEDHLVLLKAGIVIEILFFSLALGVKVRRMELEKQEAALMRLRIARDLHDELGSTLGSISVLSEAALRTVEQELERVRLNNIGEKARAALAGMSDIVWAVNPQNDPMEQVLQRMARFAAETLEAAGMEVVFTVDDPLRNLVLPMEKRKEVYLIFKEAVNNCARHSRATRARIVLEKAGTHLNLEVSDDGAGFETGDGAARPASGGNGLDNMRARAAKLGGTLQIESAPGQGTRILLKTPL
jgi:signal transduction histidine kinase